MDSLQELCREAKDEQHITISDLADKTGIPLSTVGNFFTAAKAPSIYIAGAICAELGISIDEYFKISKRQLAREKLDEANEKLAQQEERHKADLHIARLEGGMEQLTGSVAKHEKKERFLQIWVYILAAALALALIVIMGYLRFDSSIPNDGLIQNGQVSVLGSILFLLLAVGAGVIVAALLNAIRYSKNHFYEDAAPQEPEQEEEEWEKQ